MVIALAGKSSMFLQRSPDGFNELTIERTMGLVVSLAGLLSGTCHSIELL